MRLRQSREVRGVRAGDEGAAPSDGKIHSICGGVVSGLKRSRRRGVSFGPPEREIVREQLSRVLMSYQMSYLQRKLSNIWSAHLMDRGLAQQQYLPPFAYLARNSLPDYTTGLGSHSFFFNSDTRESFKS